MMRRKLTCLVAAASAVALMAQGANAGSINLAVGALAGSAAGSSLIQKIHPPCHYDRCEVSWRTLNGEPHYQSWPECWARRCFARAPFAPPRQMRQKGCLLHADSWWCPPG